MDLRSPYPYSFMMKGIIRSYPSLVNNITIEVAIIGAGIPHTYFAPGYGGNGIVFGFFLPVL